MRIRTLGRGASVDSVTIAEFIQRNALMCPLVAVPPDDARGRTLCRCRVGEVDTTDRFLIARREMIHVPSLLGPLDAAVRGSLPLVEQVAQLAHRRAELLGERVHQVGDRARRAEIQVEPVW